MTAKEKILAGISEEAQKKAEEIIADAENVARENTAEASALAESQKEKIIKDADKKAESIINNAKSSASLLKRDSALKFKSEAIETVLRAVNDEINSYPDDKYFDFLITLVKKNVLSGKGVLHLNSKDLQRNTAEFKEKIAPLNLVLSESGADISGGFILQYDDILINCAIEALIHEKREKLIDVINQKLFA